MLPLASFLRATRCASGGLAMCAAILLAACQPTIQVKAPAEPITINLNVKLDAEVRVKLEKQAVEDIRKNEDIF
jgi:hypothetical protein